MADTNQLNTLVVVGEASLARRAAELVPSFQVVGAVDDLELADPATSLARIGAMLDRGQPPAAVLCSGNPGFTVLSQLRHFPANRCYVFPGDSPWPLPTLQCLVEAAGMTLLQNLESLPVALVGRTVQGVRRPGYEDIPTGSGLEAVESVGRLKAAQVQHAARPAGGQESPPRDDFGWADTPPVQVPPAPVSLEGAIEDEDLGSVVLDVGNYPQQSASAYLPTDLLRVLRPRAGQG
ncbi:MAG TPA: hypothetical protein VNH38_06670 [Candidatus Dormibacteraeota bacterium]|nr:hypothetical protein [Candidatus Dormibacteraeota bacterium]